MPTSARGNRTKTTQKKPKPRQRGVERSESRPSRGEERRPERKEKRHREKHQGKQERREDRRLAEEQLLRRSWVQSSSEGDEGEEVNRQRGREEAGSGGRGGRREKKQRREWRQEEAHRPEARAEKRLRSEEERSRLPPATRSSSTSGSDSESGCGPPVARASADSTSHERASRSKPGESADRGGSSSSSQKPAHPRVGTPAERKKKLYTLVPFGRGERTTTASQRGLRNLLVQIDLCLLRRVPDGEEVSPVKKPLPSPSSAKDNRKDMKHPYVSDGAAKRKRKVSVVVQSAWGNPEGPVLTRVRLCARLAGKWRLPPRKQEGRPLWEPAAGPQRVRVLRGHRDDTQRVSGDARPALNE